MENKPLPTLQEVAKDIQDFVSREIETEHSYTAGLGIDCSTSLIEWNLFKKLNKPSPFPRADLTEESKQLLRQWYKTSYPSVVDVDIGDWWSCAAADPLFIVQPYVLHTYVITGNTIIRYIPLKLVGEGYTTLGIEFSFKDSLEKQNNAEESL